ncbi:hypothetical protein HXA35_18735 [Bacillus sp. A301a_S52]|jgi:hypothetical protein|nr:hypothetical protein [Bacillus sp. A301a_S52]
MKVKKIIMLMMIGMILLNGCNRPNPPEMEEGAAGYHVQEQVEERQRDWTRSMFGPGPINYDFIERQNEPYKISEANVTGRSYRSLNSPRQTEEDDQKLIEDIIYELDGVVPGMVILVGAQAWVNVMPDDASPQSYTKEEEDKLKDKIEDELKKGNPRYHYRVILNKFE